MRLSKRCQYALRILAELGLAKESGIRSLTGREISIRQRVPKQFLHQIISQLGEYGLVRSARGRSGGYFLGKPTRHIHIKEVIDLLDGKTQTERFFDDYSVRIPSLLTPAQYGLREIISKVRQDTVSAIDGITLQDVVAKTMISLRQIRDATQHHK